MQYQQPYSLWRRMGNVAMVTLNFLAALGLCASAFSSYVPPTDCKYAVVAAMTLPAWLALAVLLLIIDLIWWRRTAMVIGLAMLACSIQIADYSPLHLSLHKISGADMAHSFTLMTYNVYQFCDHECPDAAGANAQLDYILSVEPDIACIEEAEYLQPTIRNNITEQQLTRMQEIYPYVYTSREFALLSKYPAEPLSFSFPKGKFGSGDIMGWRIDINGKIVNLFGVHLRSLGFTIGQRELFEGITDGQDLNRNDLEEARSELLRPFVKASVDRMEQARLLVSYIRKFGGENVIVCGDFNDTENCYSMRLLESESALRQVYPQVGILPMITYNAHNFYFRIDHILYRGNLKPRSLERGDLKASDHYPLIATFTFDNE